MATATASAQPSVSGTLLARGSLLHTNTAVQAIDPGSGDPVLVIRLPSGSVVAYDALCTHAGCPVEYDPGSVTLICPCHGAQFDAARQAQVLGGPTNQPLRPIAIRIDPTTGDVRTAS
jgi:Rieske Fe-S protein